VFDGAAADLSDRVLRKIYYEQAVENAA
jgi:hypothetical protein